VAPEVEVDHEEAVRARRAAERELQRIKSRSADVSNISRRLRVIRERNHFAEQISRALAEKAE
jgi:hypothetical protein